MKSTQSMVQHKRKNKYTQGFTTVELVVSLVLFSLAVATAVSAYAALQTSQRNDNYLDLATSAAQRVIESAHNIAFDDLAVGTRDMTGEVPEKLPGRAATLTISNAPGISGRKLLVSEVTYKQGTVDRRVVMSSIIGPEGL